MAWLTLAPPPARRPARLGALGFDPVSLVSAVLGPIVEGGATAYAAHETSKVAKKELKQRQVEAQQQQDMARQQLEAQQQAALLAQQASVQRAQLWQSTARQAAPYVGLGLGLLAVGFVVAKIVRSRG